MKSHAPTAISALDKLHKTRTIPCVGIIVAGEKIPKFIKRQLLRIAHARRKNFKARAIRIAPHHAARITHLRLTALLVLHVDAAISDGEIKLPIRPKSQPVHIVPAKRKLHPKARKQPLLRIRLRVSIRVLKAPQTRDIRPPHLTASRQNPSRRPVQRLAKPIRKHRRLVRLPVAVRIIERHDALLLRLKCLLKLRRVRIKLPHHRQSVRRRARSDVLI